MSETAGAPVREAASAGRVPRGAPPASPYRSFWMGGFEGADHLNGRGEALDMVALTGHDRQVDRHYRQMARMGMGTVRESLGWRLCEPEPGRFDFERALRFARAAREHGVQILWTLMHYGTPADVDLFDDAFCERFARYARAAAEALRRTADEPPVYTLVNEISFVSWAASETRLLHPYGERHAQDREGSSLASGFDLKRRLVRATLMAMEAVREADPRARFLHIEPVVHVVPPHDRPELQPLADEVRNYQWQTWDMLAGRLEPELGGRPEALDLVGVNHYHSGQWEVVTEKRLHWHLRDPRRAPFSRLLAETWQRYHRPITVAETSHVGSGRAQWLDEIATEVQLALAAGVPVQGLCLYPIVDRPDWDDLGHWHHSGLWDHIEPGHSTDHREHGLREPGCVLNLHYAKTLRRWQRRLGLHQDTRARPC